MNVCIKMSSIVKVFCILTIFINSTYAEFQIKNVESADGNGYDLLRLLKVRDVHMVADPTRRYLPAAAYTDNQYYNLAQAKQGLRNIFEQPLGQLTRLLHPQTSVSPPRLPLPRIRPMAAKPSHVDAHTELPANLFNSFNPQPANNPAILPPFKQPEAHTELPANLFNSFIPQPANNPAIPTPFKQPEATTQAYSPPSPTVSDDLISSLFTSSAPTVAPVLAPKFSQGQTPPSISDDLISSIFDTPQPVIPKDDKARPPLATPQNTASNIIQQEPNLDDLFGELFNAPETPQAPDQQLSTKAPFRRPVIEGLITEEEEAILDEESTTDSLGNRIDSNALKSLIG